MYTFWGILWPDFQLHSDDTCNCSTFCTYTHSGSPHNVMHSSSIMDLQPLNNNNQLHESICTCTAAILHDWKLAWKDRGAITVCGEQGSDIIHKLFDTCNVCKNFYVAWRVMQTLEIWSRAETYHVIFKDYLVITCLCHSFSSRHMPELASTNIYIAWF